MTSQLVGSLELGWKDIQQAYSVPEAVILVGSGGRKSALLNGHFCPNSWAKQEGEATDKVHEVLIVAERLNRPAAEIFNTLLHESVHALANSLEIKDCSGQRHNKKFRNLAETMGMVYEQERSHPSLGFSQVTMLPETELRFAKAIERIEQALKFYRRPELKESANKPVQKYSCECDREVSWSKKFFEQGPVICGLCSVEFKEIDD